MKGEAIYLMHEGLNVNGREIRTSRNPWPQQPGRKADTDKDKRPSRGRLHTLEDDALIFLLDDRWLQRRHNRLWYVMCKRQA